MKRRKGVCEAYEGALVRLYLVGGWPADDLADLLELVERRRALGSRTGHRREEEWATGGLEGRPPEVSIGATRGQQRGHRT